MFKLNTKKIRKLNMITHRDLGYFFSSLIIVYCISGIALNHVDDWNPDFILKKDVIAIDKKYTKSDVDENLINEFGNIVEEGNYKIYDFPTNDQVKIYYDNASLHVYLSENKAIFEQVAKRPIFYQTNVIHRNSLEGWKYVSDIFAILLITITLTGVFVLRGKHGISGRGKWLIISGAIAPLLAIIIQTI